MTITAAPTGTHAGGSPNYADSQRSATYAPSLNSDYLLILDTLRTRTDVLGGEMQEVHAHARKADLDNRTAEKVKKSVASLLEELTETRGMGWSDIAEVVGVSISAIRKWRKGGHAGPENRKGLARIAALLDVLEEKVLIEDPTGWMEVDLSLEPGYFIRPLDLYLEGGTDALIDLAEHRKSPTEVLDQVRPNWRSHRSNFEVFVDSDGDRSIRQRRD